MRRLMIIAATSILALAVAAVAIAVTTAAGVSTTTATFDAAKGNIQTRTCTGQDNKTYEVTRGKYTGTVDFSNPSSDLDGPLTINARTVYSTSDNLGYVDGTFRVKDGDSRVSGRFSGTLDGSHNLVGFLDGWSSGDPCEGARQPERRARHRQLRERQDRCRLLHGDSSCHRRPGLQGPEGR